jgi:hypothetical protein
MPKPLISEIEMATNFIDLSRKWTCLYTLKKLNQIKTNIKKNISYYNIGQLELLIE